MKTLDIKRVVNGIAIWGCGFIVGFYYSHGQHMKLLRTKLRKMVDEELSGVPDTEVGERNSGSGENDGE